MLPRDRFGLGDEDPDVEDSAIVAPSRDCFSPYWVASDKLDMKDAVRRFRSRFDGWDSSLRG
tara:strand:+ start:14656 stop:14841 length:186 start_codon:yes stop_codon:yes gene_type:complete